MLLTADGTVLLLIDLQERLMPAIADNEAVIARSARLAQAARLLDVPVYATEQYPAGLGSTVAPLAAYARAVLPKTTFSAAADPGRVAARLAASQVPRGAKAAQVGVRPHSKPEVSPAPRRTISGSGSEKSITVVGSVPQSPESITASTL